MVADHQAGVGRQSLGFEFDIKDPECTPAATAEPSCPHLHGRRPKMPQDKKSVLGHEEHQHGTEPKRTQDKASVAHWLSKKSRAGQRRHILPVEPGQKIDCLEDTVYRGRPTDFRADR